MNANQFTILVVDDEPDLLEFISYNLENYGYKVYTARTGTEGIQRAKEIFPDLILLDVMMPDMDGIIACEELRKIPELEHVVIAFLTARGEDYSQIAGLNAGGDDYITKPVRPKVLISRINALLKRKQKSSPSEGSTGKTGEAPSIITKGNIKIDKERYVVQRDDEELTLPRKEFELLILLLSNPNKVISRDKIFSSIWGEGIIVSDRTIDVHIRKIREKLPDLNIKTIKGVGYKFVE